MKKKVLYFIESLSRLRVIKSFREDPDLDQLVVGPKPVVYSGISEDYTDIGIKNIKLYDTHKTAKRIIRSFHPDIAVLTDMVGTVKFPRSSKRVFVMHGMIGNHIQDYFKPEDCEHWSGFDLYCGATKEFESWVKYVVGDKEVLLDALPQFDFFYPDNYKTPLRKKIVNQTKSPNSSKVILFCGFCCGGRGDFKDHNEDYFSVVEALSAVAEKNDWLVLIKPRQSSKSITGFMASSGLSKTYGDAYKKAQKNKHLYFIDPNSSIYHYFFADLIVCNGCSTIEFEACLAHKPLVVVRSKLTTEQYDPFDTVRFGAGEYVSKISDLEGTIVRALESDSHIIKQDEFVKSKGITIDGLAYKRIQDKIKKL